MFFGTVSLSFSLSLAIAVLVVQSNDYAEGSRTNNDSTKYYHLAVRQIPNQ
jgi:hypothetical protein